MVKIILLVLCKFANQEILGVITMKYSIRIGLLVVIAVLGYLTYESIAEPIRYQKQVDIKEKRLLKNYLFYEMVSWHIVTIRVSLLVTFQIY